MFVKFQTGNTEWNDLKTYNKCYDNKLAKNDNTLTKPILIMSKMDPRALV